MKQRIESVLKQQSATPAPDGILNGVVSAKPADGTAGYSPACILQDIVNKAVYINEGTLASCDFKTVTTS